MKITASRFLTISRSHHSMGARWITVLPDPNVYPVDDWRTESGIAIDDKRLMVGTYICHPATLEKLKHVTI